MRRQETDVCWPGGPLSDTGREREGLKAISALDPGVQGTDPEGVESH